MRKSLPSGGAMTSGKRLAKSEVLDAFGGFYGTNYKHLRCLVHKNCDGPLDHHHLDERGNEGLSSWYFENMVPICKNLNGFIEQVRKPWRREEVITSDNVLGKSALENSYQEYQRQGELFRAYALSRLGAFLTASPRVRPEPDATIGFAAKCLWTLRGVAPKFGIRLATDTLARSVLKYVDSLGHANGDVKVMLDLASAVGSFHRDFGDQDTAARYYRLGLELANLGRLDWSDGYLLRLARNIRVFLSGFSEPSASHDLLLLIQDRSGFGATLHERSHIQQMNYRQYCTGTSDQRQKAAEDFLEEKERLDKLALCQGLTKSNRPLSKGVVRSRWDDAEIACLSGDAYAALGDLNEACDVMRNASRLEEEGHFAVAGLPRPRVFDFLHWKYPNDASLSFTFREPGMLWKKPRRGTTDAFWFGELSAKLIDKMKQWIGVSSPITSPTVCAIQDLLIGSSIFK
jgi:hypothetical protein